MLQPTFVMSKILLRLAQRPAAPVTLILDLRFVSGWTGHLKSELKTLT
jgi:hypothetical protein